MRVIVVVLALLLSWTSIAGPATVNNDDSCDIGVYPAATLLLPYFEVDLDSPQGVGETTIFTITNTTNLPQVAHVTLWTDFAYPVIAFDIYLTGYDVQSVNLYDVIARGQIAPDDGTGADVSPVGRFSGTSRRSDWDNPLLDESTCAGLPVQIPQVFITRMQSAFNDGRIPSSSLGAGCNRAGGAHDNAVGYATIDVVGACTTKLPIEGAYYTDVLRFDNVLTGDYIQVNSGEDFAHGSPLVHIRAIPEGGLAKPGKVPSFQRTFYSRFQGGGKLDRRQPLPAIIAARWISGGATGFETSFKIWREGWTTENTACADYVLNGGLAFVETVRFDEEENPEILKPGIIVTPITFYPVLPSTSMTNVSNTSIFPPNTGGSVAGWFYMNLDNNSRDQFASQNWVVTSMRAEERFSVDIESLHMGNGCTPPLQQSEAYDGAQAIGPPPNLNPRP